MLDKPEVMGKTGGGYCAESQRLLAVFGDAVKELMALHEQQFSALIDGDLDFTRFDSQIHAATEKKQSAKYAYLAHIEEHGCA